MRLIRDKTAAPFICLFITICIIEGHSFNIAYAGSISQTTSSSEINKHIDIKWFKKSLIEDNLSHWLRAAPTKNGFFKTKLNYKWHPYKHQRATLVSQGRLLYVFAKGYDLTQDEQYLTALKNGADFLLDNFQSNSRGEWYWSVASDGKEKKFHASLNDYGSSFVIFGLSHAYRITGDIRYRDAAFATVNQLRVWQNIETQNSDTSKVVYSQNPIMHIFEALLTLHDATGDNRLLKRAQYLIEFIFTTLYQETEGYLPEKFDVNWKPLPSKEGGYIDIGHQFEWAYLLSWAVEKGFPRKYIDFGQRLLNFGMENGYDYNQGGIFSNSSYIGVISGSKGWWQQCELLRTLMRYNSIHGRRDLWQQFDQSLKFVKKYFLDSKYGGWFKKPIDPTNTIITGKENALLDKGNPWKVGYHTTGMYIQALQLDKRILKE